MPSKNIISFVLITVCILVLPESSPELLNFWIWDMEPANVKSVEKKCIQHRLTNCLGRENTNCINQFRVNLSVNKLIVFCYALKSSKIFWCWSQIIVTIEDGAISGGAGSAVNEWAQENNIKSQTIICGIPDEFIEHASREEMIEMAGLDANSIIAKVKKYLP